MPLGEPRDLVEGLVGFVQCSEVELEDVRAFGGHLQRHIDVVPAGVRGQPDRVVQEHLMGADLDQQRGKVGQRGEDRAGQRAGPVSGGACTGRRASP